MERLRAQADEYAVPARWLLAEVGLEPGSRALDVGCGPVGVLPLLAEAVGTSGEVVGLERERRFVEMARAEMSRLGLRNVTIVESDALSSGLEDDSFDIVHERLVLVNLPERRDLVTKMVGLAAPGGVVAVEEIDNISWTCEPEHDSWTALLDVFHRVFRMGGGDPFLGRRLTALLRATDLIDVQTRVTVDLPAPGEYRRTHLLSLVESLRGKVIASGAMAEVELDHHRAALAEHLADPETVVVDKLLVQSWGRKPS